MRTAVLALVLTSATVFAQAPAGPAFTTVSIKHSDVRGVGSRIAPMPDGSLTTLGAPLIVLIQMAYPVYPLNIVGLPGWTRFVTYDVVATSPLRRDATADERRAMIRAMLEDRFRLVAHIEDRGQAVPNLVPMAPTDDTRRLLVVDHIDFPAEN